MPADDHRLTTEEMARFVAEGYLRFDALVSADLNQRIIEELQGLEHVKLRQAIGAPQNDSFREIGGRY